MKTNRHPFLFALVASASVACATANEEPQPEPVQPVAEIGPVDTATADTTSDTGAPVDTSVVDIGPDAETCTYPASETKPCGYCGTYSRTCLPSGFWSEFSECSGERGGGECKVGDKRTSDCGNCGTLTEYCDTSTCAWTTTGFCAGEGPCAVGDEESTRASCTALGEVRVRKCDSKCQWSDYSTCGLQRGWLAMETAPITARMRHAAIWTGSKMIVWGGIGASSSYKADGAAYEPLTNTWTTIAAPPSGFAGRQDPHAVWTGSKMIVFGGRDSSAPRNDVAIYDPATNTWSSGAVSPLTKRWGAAYAWSTTTNELLVWGGYLTNGNTAVTNNGAAYSPATDTWTALPPAPIEARGEVNSVWTGTEMIVFGGSRADLSDLVDGARFDPATRAWTKFSAPSSSVFAARYNQGYVWTGSAFAAWGGLTTPAGTILGNGATYTPMIGWVGIPEPTDAVLPPLARRHLPTVFHAGGKLYVFSGIAAGSSNAIGGMAAYDLAAGSWSNVSTTNAPSARVRASAVWTGREAIVFGGATSDSTSSTLNTGGMYRP